MDPVLSEHYKNITFNIRRKMKSFKKFVEEPTNVTGPDIAGINKDDTPGPGKLARRKKKKKDDEDETNEGQFAGIEVFDVSSDDFVKAREGKKRYERMSRFFDDVTDGVGKQIHDFSKKFPNKSIIVRNEKTQGMFFLRKK